MRDETKRRRLSLTAWILLGLVGGVAVGLAQNLFLPASWNEASIRYFHEPVGRLFLNAIRLVVVPLVLVSLTLGTAAIGDIRRLGRIGGKTMAIYLSTTVLAVSIGFGLASAVQPGSGIAMPADASFKPVAPPGLVDVLVGFVPVNPFAALVEGNMLQIIFIAMLAGMAIAWAGEAAGPVLRGLKAADGVVQRMVHIVMFFAPVGVFGLMAKVVIGQGAAVFLPLLKYMSTVFAALLLQALVVYPAYLLVFGRLDPRRFYAAIRSVMLVAFSTSSSNATLPVSMAAAGERLGVREDIYSFTLPLGATINMDGTAIMQGVATVFVANVYGIALGPTEFFQVVLMATLASIGTAGVPGAGIIMLSMVLVQVGVPVEGIAIVLGVDRILDMSRTVVNVTGDLMATAVVARSEGAMDVAGAVGGRFERPT